MHIKEFVHQQQPTLFKMCINGHWFCDFQEIATRYPDVPLSTVLIAEKKFVEADLDRNGVSEAKSNVSFYLMSHCATYFF